MTQACIIFVVHYQPCSFNWSQTLSGFVEEQKTNLMSLAILFHFLCAQHVLDINICIIRSCASACNTDTKNITTTVVIQQHSPKVLMMDILTFRRLMSTIVVIPHR